MICNKAKIIVKSVKTGEYTVNPVKYRRVSIKKSR